MIGRPILRPAPRETTRQSHFVMVEDEPGAGRPAIALNWAEELKRLIPTR